MVEEVTIRFSKVGVRWRVMCEGEMEVFIKKFVFLVKAMMQGERNWGRNMCLLPDGVGI
jgi:hypothetical protein